ncbi:hypothetical protein V8C35DRAFT_300848 [Trichoderma chlorosporum]
MPIFGDTSWEPSPSQRRAWNKAVEPRMWCRLGEDYWRRFNIMPIAILNEEAYFNAAMEVAQLANGQEAEFERIFEERNRMQREKIDEVRQACLYRTIYEREFFPCERSLYVVGRASSVGSLQYFLELLDGIAHGWEANATRVQIDTAAGRLSEETEKMQEPLDLRKEIQSDASCWEAETQIFDEFSEPRLLGTFDFEKGNNNKKAPRKRKRVRFNENVFDASGKLRKLWGTTASSSIYGSATDEISTLDDVGDDIHGPVHKRRKLESITAGPSRYASIHGNATDEASTLDDVGDDNYDLVHKPQELEITTASSSPCTSIYESATEEVPTLDDVGDDNYDLVHKRRELESFFAIEPTVINPSPQLPADKGTIKKRSRSDDCDDDDDADADAGADANDYYGPKRRKLDIPTTCTPSQASVSSQRLAGEKVAMGKSRRRHRDSLGCHSRKSKKSPPTISRSLRSTVSTKRALRSTISAKSAVQSEFWELDHSGKPHSI